MRAQCDCQTGQKLETERDLITCIIRTMAEEKIALPSGTVPTIGE